jgi:phosphoglycolate phosphatase-like HAD superfamily hydrolase/uridine kinase
MSSICARASRCPDSPTKDERRLNNRNTTGAADVELLIFDLDGTISSTTRPIYEAVKRAFARLNLTLSMTAEEMEKYFGAPSPEFYIALTPPGSNATWQEIKEKIHEEQAETYRQYGETYPGVKETLKILRKREYKLALFSNSTPGYFDTVIDALEIREYFDYTECIGENNLTKSGLAGKIRKEFGNPRTAVVGDRIHDLEAARDNDSLSIGSLYGYGGSEPEQADFTISKFTELLDIFDRRIPIFEKILDDITSLKQPDHPFIIGITGIDASGKTMFTDGLGNFLSGKKYPVQVIHLDDFHNPTKIRYAGENNAENYFNLSFNFENIISELLAPAREHGNLSTGLTVLDLETDSYRNIRSYSISPNTIVLLEGVFLFRKELSSYLDYYVYLDISFEECLKRGLERAGKEERYRTKYIPAHKKYLAEYPPSEYADIIIDNSTWEYPRITFSR